MRAEARVKALLNANRKKSVHVSLFAKTHHDFKKAVLDKDLSMQEVFEFFATQFSEGHPGMVKMIDDYCETKKEKLISQLEDKYAENLYEAIGHDSPFDDQE